MATKKEDVKFEDNLAELENIVRKLESGDVALEDAIAEFQKGMKISETLKKTLMEADKSERYRSGQQTDRTFSSVNKKQHFLFLRP